MRRRRRRPDLALPERRLVVPVLAATGGAGRSTVCHLLAARFAAHARTLVIDTAPGLASPWPGWLTRPGSAALPADITPTAQQVFAAAGVVNTGYGAEFAVLHGEQSRPAEDGSGQVDPARRLVRTVSARVSVVDTTTPLLPALAAAATTSPRPRTGRTDASGWRMPVLCVPASAKGVADAMTTVTALEQRALPATDLHVAVVGIAASDLPRRVLAGLTLLQPQVAAVVRLPHDPRLRATSRPCTAPASSRLQKAIDDLAHQLCASAATPQGPQAPAPTDTADASV